MSELELMREFGRNLKYELGLKHISQNKLAKKLFVGKSLISKYVNGECMPSLKMFINIVNILGCNPEDLIRFDDQIRL